MQANAVFLLRQKRDDPEWNASMAPYWESLPSIGQSITKESMPTDALHLLQDPVLEASIVVRGALTKNVFDGGKPAIIQSFADDLPGVSLELFRHLTSVVSPFSLFLSWAAIPVCATARYELQAWCCASQACSDCDSMSQSACRWRPTPSSSCTRTGYPTGEHHSIPFMPQRGGVHLIQVPFAAHATVLTVQGVLAGRMQGLEVCRRTAYMYRQKPDHKAGSGNLLAPLDPRLL